MAPPVLATTKSDFLRARFAAEPELSLEQARAAWQEAGHEDVISSSLFYIIKRRSLAAPGRHGRRATRTPGMTAAALTNGDRNSARAPAGPDRSVCDEVEDRIDDLIVLIKVNGGQPAVEAALRAARRLLLQP